MTLVRAFLDLAADAHPVHRVRVELLRDDLEAEAHRRVADLLLAEDREPTVDIFARDRGLELLEAEEVLLVDVPKTIDALFELTDRDLLLFGVTSTLRKCLGGRSAELRAGQAYRGVTFTLSKQTLASHSLKPKWSWP